MSDSEDNEHTSKTKGSYSGNALRLIGSVFTTFMFSVLCGTVLIILNLNGEQYPSKSIADIGITIGIFSIIVATMQIIVTIYTLSNSKTTKVARACLAFAIIMLIVFIFYFFDLNNEWYTSKQSSTISVSLGAIILILSLAQLILMFWVAVKIFLMYRKDKREKRYNRRVSNDLGNLVFQVPQSPQISPQPPVLITATLPPKGKRGKKR
jgi:lysylphosphatidylglycerol synthetase-like protein (DUF2156 family)